MSRIAGVILAAGSSSRLGSPKQLLQLGKDSVLALTVSAVRQANLDLTVVVVGHRAGEILETIEQRGLVIIENPDYASGQSSSVRAAVRALPGEIDAAVFILGDQPLVEPIVIDRLAEAFRRTAAPIIQPRYAEGRGNPVLIARDLFPELLRLTGDTGARPLLAKYAERVHLVDLTDHHRPDDIDTWDDYQRVRQEFERIRAGECQ